MKKRIKSKKLITSLAISTLVLGLFVTTVINADETEVTTSPEIQEVDEITEEEIIEEQEVVEEVVEEVTEITDNDTSVEQSSAEEKNQDTKLLKTSGISTLTASSLIADTTTLGEAFPDSIFRQYVAENILGLAVYDENTKITSLDIATIEATATVNVNKMDIASLDGIEFFIGLTTLSCQDNLLTELNVSTLTSLESLDCSRNLLTALDVSTLTQLKTLYCYNNELQELDLTNLYNIQILNFANTSISTIEVSHMDKLVSLAFGNTNISEINISDTAKSNMALLAYNFTNIESLDISGFPKIHTLNATKATGGETNKLTYVIMSGSNRVMNTSSDVRVRGTAGFMSWDSSIGYYVLKPGMNITYAMEGLYLDEDGEAKKVVSIYTSLPEGGLMDSEGNIIVGADASNVDPVTGTITLPSGGIYITGDIIYTFDDNTTFSGDTVVTDGNIIVEKNTVQVNESTGNVEAVIGGNKTEVQVPVGEKATLTVPTENIEIPTNSKVINNSGDETYLTGSGNVNADGDVTSNNPTVTVPADKVDEVTTNEKGEIVFPNGGIVNDNGQDVNYPGTIIFNPDDGSLKYVPIDDLLNEAGNDLGEGITQKDIDDARAIVDSMTEGSLTDQLTEIVDTAQNILNAKNAVEDLFTDGTHTDIPDDLTQADINNAQDLVDKIPDGALKDELQKEIDKAQDMLNARDEVNSLFTDDTHTDIPDGLTQKDIDSAQDAVDKLPSGALKDELQKEIDKAQDMLDAKDKVDNLFTDGTHTDITDGLTQKEIDSAQDAINKLPEGSLKDELQKEIDKAQDMLDAKDKVDDLFTDGNHTDIKDGLTQKEIDDAQDLVNKLPDGALKDELQKEIDKAQDMMNAKDAVGDLLDKDGNLNSGVTQEDIDNAQDLVNKLPDGKLKDELQAIIDEAQKQLDAQNTNNPSTVPTVVKPNVSGGATTGGSTVNTSDMTNTTVYFSLLVSSIALLGLLAKKRRKSVK